MFLFLWRTLKANSGSFVKIWYYFPYMFVQDMPEDVVKCIAK